MKLETRLRFFWGVHFFVTMKYRTYFHIQYLLVIRIESAYKFKWDFLKLWITNTTGYLSSAKLILIANFIILQNFMWFDFLNCFVFLLRNNWICYADLPSLSSFWQFEIKFFKFLNTTKFVFKTEKINFFIASLMVF